MNIETLREYCLSKSGAEETLPFGPDTLVYKVGGKVFLLVGLDAEDLRFNVKCDPDKAIELREEYPDSILPGYHMNKKHWIGVYLNSDVPDALLLSLLKASYNIVLQSLPKKERTAIENSRF